MPDTLLRPPLPGAGPAALFTERVERLSVLSYNVQAGISTHRYGDYITGSWKHVLPFPERWTNLERIGDRVRGFDIVALQELDGGSLRTGFVSQTRYLARHSEFPRWRQQTNRRIGLLSRHCNGLLSRVEVNEYVGHRLPGPRGRGALLATIGSGEEHLAVIIAHLSLGQRQRMKQAGYLAELVNYHRHAILLGDFNCEPDSDEIELLLRHTDLDHPTRELNTFPSWRPKRRIDHVLVTPQLQVHRSYAPQWRHSDHLPIAVDIDLPPAVEIFRALPRESTAGVVQ